MDLLDRDTRQECRATALRPRRDRPHHESAGWRNTPAVATSRRSSSRFTRPSKRTRSATPHRRAARAIRRRSGSFSEDPEHRIRVADVAEGTNSQSTPFPRKQACREHNVRAPGPVASTSPDVDRRRVRQHAQASAVRMTRAVSWFWAKMTTARCCVRRAGPNPARSRRAAKRPASSIMPRHPSSRTRERGISTPPPTGPQTSGLSTAVTPARVQLAASVTW